MRKLPVIVAAVSALWALPAFAGELNAPASTEPAVTLAQLDVCVGPDCRRDRERRYYDRYDRERDHDWRYRERERGCRDITIRERRGDEVIVRHERRC
jgi:hypothetical protein